MTEIKFDYNELDSHIEDNGNTIFYKEDWDKLYKITLFDDEYFQATYGNEFLGNHEYIEDCMKDIEDHIKEN